MRRSWIIAAAAGGLLAAASPAPATHWARVSSGTIRVATGVSATKIVSEQNGCSPVMGPATFDGFDGKVVQVPAAWRGRSAKVVMSPGFASVYRSGCTNRETHPLTNQNGQWIVQFPISTSHRTLILAPSFTAGANVAWELWVQHPG